MIKEKIGTEATFINSYCKKDDCPIIQAQEQIREAEISLTYYEKAMSKARQICRKVGLLPQPTYSSWLSFINKTTREQVVIRTFDGPIFKSDCSEGVDLPEGQSCGQLVVGCIAKPGDHFVISRLSLDS